MNLSKAFPLHRRIAVTDLSLIIPLWSVSNAVALTIHLSASDSRVVPIDWKRFDKSIKNKNVVADEGNRFLAPGYKVPNRTLPDGHVDTPGDTRAEDKKKWNALLKFNS